jgi:hypothetical protein
MSEKDRKLLGTVFGMAGGAYGGYAGSAGFGSSGIGATGASGSAGGMGGQSPKVGGDYGTAMNLYSQPTVPGAGPGYYGSGPVGNVSNTGYQYMPAMGTEYAPIEASNNPYISQYVGNADAPADIGYFANPVKPNPYLGPNVGNADAPAALFQMNSPINDASVMNDWQAGIGGNPVYQGPLSLDTSAQTFALDSPSRTIDLAPSGTPLEVVDASAYTSPPEPFYGVDPNSPTASGSNLGMESVYNSGGNPDIELVPSTGDGYLISPDDQVRLIQSNGDGTFTDLSATSDLSTPQGVEEFINMDQIRADEMPGGPLDPLGTGPNITVANSSVYGPPQSVGSYIEDGVIIDNSLNADPRSLYQNSIRSAALDAPVDSVRRPILSDGIKAQAAYDAEVPLLDPQGTPAGLKAEKDAIKFQAEYGNTPEQVQATAQEKVDKARKKLSEGAKRGDNRVIEREQQNIASTIDEVRSTMQKQMTEDPSKWQQFLDKIPNSVKEWATMTGVSLLDMWIKQSLFGQDYDDQIAQGGGGGGVLRGSSPVVSPYSGGGSGGGGKGVLFSMGGSGQQGRGTHIMALQ